mmetsp:Transcript_121643/g.190858  ORF Transcript_121643/g.190858 Transcript_121643/m.190858 type:complete len:106 (-) Transcript_121643:10-327(-)
MVIGDDPRIPENAGAMTAGADSRMPENAGVEKTAGAMAGDCRIVPSIIVGDWRKPPGYDEPKAWPIVGEPLKASVYPCIPGEALIVRLTAGFMARPRNYFEPMKA